MATINVKGFTARILASRRVVPTSLGGGMVPPVTWHVAPGPMFFASECEACPNATALSCPGDSGKCKHTR